MEVADPYVLRFHAASQNVQVYVSIVQTEVKCLKGGSRTTTKIWMVLRVLERTFKAIEQMTTSACWTIAINQLPLRGKFWISLNSSRQLERMVYEWNSLIWTWNKLGLVACLPRLIVSEYRKHNSSRRRGAKLYALYAKRPSIYLSIYFSMCNACIKDAEGLKTTYWKMIEGKKKKR